MTRKGMAWSSGPVPVGGFVRVFTALALAGITWAAAAAAADYELRLVPYDAPGTFVSDRVQEDQDYSWIPIFYSLSESERARFFTPYLCWPLNIKLDGKPAFEIYEKGLFIARLPKARPQLKPGKHTIWPGDHVFTVEKDGSLSTEDPELVITKDMIEGRPFHVLLIKCYPFSVKAKNIDPRAARPKSMRDEIPVPKLTVRDAKDSAAGEARKAEAARREAEDPDAKPISYKSATELMPGVNKRFLRLTAWLPAHTSGEGYVLFPLKQRFYLGADGVRLLGGDDERMPGWKVNGYQIVIPAVPIPVSGELNTELIVTGVQKLEFTKTKLSDSAMLYARRAPYEFRVSRGGAALMIDPNLSNLPNKLFRVEVDPSYRPYQRGLVVETDTRHLSLGQKVRARIRAVAPAAGERRYNEAEQAANAARAAAKEIEQLQNTIAARTRDRDNVVKKKEQGRATDKEVKNAQNRLNNAKEALAKAEVRKKKADEEAAAANARANTAADNNGLGDATPFVRLRASDAKEWVDLAIIDRPDGTIEFTVPELVDGVYEIRMGVTPAQKGHRNFYIDQWTTVAAGTANGIGVFTQRGRTAFFRGEPFWLAVAVTATAKPITAGTPLTIDLVDSSGARIPFYHAEIQQRIPERETFILNVSPATSNGLAPGKYHVEAKLGERAGPPFDLEIVDPAPETHFTKLLMGKYNQFGFRYSDCLTNKEVSPDDIARAIADTYNAFKGMSYGMDRVVFPDRGLADLVRERPELGPWEAYAPPSGRDQFLNALARYNVRFYENLFTQHDTMMPRGDMIMKACERYTTLETQSMRHSPVFRGVCLYDEFSQSLDHDTNMDMVAYFRRADEMNYRRKYNGRTSSEALRARDRFFSHPPGRRDIKDLEIYKTWPKHLDDQWGEFSQRMSDMARAVMPESVNFTLARIHALPGGNIDRTWEPMYRPLDVALTVGYKDMGGWGTFACAGPICADSLRMREGLQVWPTIYGNGSGRFGSSNVRQAFFTLSQKCEGLSFMQFDSTPDAPLATSGYWGHSHFDALTDISTICTRYGDLLLAAERGYKKVAIYRSRELSYVFGGGLACEELWTACMRAGYPADFITDDQLLAGKAMEYDVIFAPGIGQMDSIPKNILDALKNIADAKDKILAVEIQSQLKLDGMVRINSYLNEIAGGETFPKHLDHDDERWWDKTVQTTQAIHDFMKEHKIVPAARHSLLVGPDWLKCNDGHYMILPNLARTDFTGNHKTIYQAPSRPTLEIPAERFPAGHERVCYDMLEMKRLETTTKTGKDNKQWIIVRPDMRYYPGKMLAFMPAEIESVVIKAMPSVKAGATLSYEIYAADKKGKIINAGIPLEITIAVPAAPPAPGKELQKTYRAATPTYRGAYGVPVNISGNSLTMRVRELISGRVAETTISVEAGRLVPVTLDTTLVRMPEPKKVREFMQKGTAVAKPLFTADDLLHPGRLALRIRDGEDKLSMDLRAGLAPETLKLFEAHKPDTEPSDELASALLSELNKVVATGRLYTDARFPPGCLTIETGRIGPLVTDESDWPDLNRQLLEEYDLYKQDIIQRYPVYIAVEEEWVRPQAERIAKALREDKGLRVRVTHMEPWQRAAGAITPTGESAGDLILDGTRMWRGTVVTPGVFVDGPLILLGSRKGMVTALIGRDLLSEPVSENFPGPGKAIVAWIHQAFSNDNDTVAVLANDAAGLERGVDALLGVTQQQTPARSLHPVVEEPRFDDKARLVEVTGKKLEPLSYHDSYRDEDRVVTMDVDPATGRILVGTFGYGHNLFCFSHEGELLWKTFLPEHDVYLLRWYDGGKRILASTAHGFYIFLINGQDGKVLKKFASTEWPDFHSDREFNTQVTAALNPKIRQILITGRTGLLAVTYEGAKMWFYDRAQEIVAYPPEAIQTSWAGFGNYLQMATGVPSPDGTKVAYNEFRLFASMQGMSGPVPLWKNEPQILDAKTGKVLLKNLRDQGANDLWKITWPTEGQDRDGDGQPDPWIHALNLRAPLLFDTDFKANGKPNPGRLGEFEPPLNPTLKIGGRLQADVHYAEGFDSKGRSIWVVADKNFWVNSLDLRNADDTRLYRCSRDGLVRCIDLRTGKVLWDYKLKCAARMRNAADNNVIAGARDGTIARFDADGKVVWKTRLREHHEMPGDNYGDYLTAAKRRDIDSTREMYPVYNDTPDDYNNGTPNDPIDDILRMGIQQLDNGGFEIPNDEFNEDERWRTTSGKVQFDTLAHEGKKSLRLAAGQLVNCTVQRKVIPSATYLLEFYYRTDSYDTILAAGALLIGPRAAGAEGSGSTPLTVSNFKAKPEEWTFGRLAVKSWADTKTIVVGFEAGDGQVHVDSVSFRPVRFPSANLLADPELHKVAVTHPEDYRIQYPRIPPPLKQKLLTENNVTAFLQATPLGALIFTQEQAFLYNGKIDDIGQMWCYRPERIGFGVMLAQPAWVSHLVLYMNNGTPDTVYPNIVVLANDMEKKVPYTVALVRGNQRRFVVVNLDPPIFTDNLKVLPGKCRAQRDSITEIEAYGPVGGPEMMKEKKPYPDKLATSMFMGSKSHVPASLPDDLVGAYESKNLGSLHEIATAYHAGATAVNGTLSFAGASGWIADLPLTKETADAYRKKTAERRKKTPDYKPGWKIGTVTPLTTPARYAGRLIAGSADYKMHAVADNGVHIWAFETGGRIYSSPIPDRDEVYFGSDDGQIYKIDIDSGILIWEFQTGDRIRSSPALDDKKVYVASWDGFVYAVDIVRGTQAWKAPIARYSSSSPAVHRGRIYVGDEEGDLHCLNAGNGASIWKTSIGGMISMCPIVTPEGIFVTSDNGTAALVAMNGAVTWKRDVLKPMRKPDEVPPRFTGQPFATKTQVVVPSTKALLVLKRADGTPDTRFVPPVPGGNYVSAVRYGEALCLVENRNQWQQGEPRRRFIVANRGEAIVWEPK